MQKGLLLLVLLMGLVFSVVGQESTLESALSALGSEDEVTVQNALISLETSLEADRVIELFEAFREGSLFQVGDEVVIALSTVTEGSGSRVNRYRVVGSGELRTEGFMLSDAVEIKANRQGRLFMAERLPALLIQSADISRVVQALESADPIMADDGFLAVALGRTKDEVRSVRDAAFEFLGLAALAGRQTGLDLATLITFLGEHGSAKAVPGLEAMKSGAEPALKEVIEKALQNIAAHQDRVRMFDILKSSLSSASIFILVALGLSITFGLMGVINMAHGELLMLGAYTTYVLQVVFGHTTENPAPEFFLFAIPMSFMVSAMVGWLIEATVVRRLYKRPIESLLATYGVSLILVQVVRLIFGDNRATNSPLWLQGAWEIAPDMGIPFNRLFIFGLAVVSMVVTWLIMTRTRMGLDMRATMQNRDMAASMGINTRRVDSLTFMLGSGFAGVAGCALTTIGGITPDMGKNYIVDSFLVVVTGGVGNLAGVVASSTLIGFGNKILEGIFFGAVWAKILILVAVMAFIQFKPKGLFAPKGRTSDE